MLRILRSKKISKKIWIALSILIIPAFCLWGFGSALRSKKEPVFIGKAFGKSVSRQEYLRNYIAVRNQLLIKLGKEQLAKLERYLNLENQVWDRILLLQEAKRKKISISNKEIVDSIKQYPFFQKNGQFIPALYQDIITYVFHATPRVFEEEMRDNLAIIKLYQLVTEQISLSDGEVKQAYLKQNEQISLDYICTSAEDFLNDASVQENEALDYYNKNPKEFSKPLSYNLNYIKLSNEDGQLINKIAELLQQGINLQEAIKDTALEIKETGLFSIEEPIPQIGWSTEILKALSELEQNNKTWPKPILVSTESSYFISLKEKKDPYVPPFNEVSDKVSLKLRQQKASQIAQEKLNACRNETETLGFMESANKFNLKTGKTELFKRRSYVEGLGDSDVFFDSVENLKEEQVSQIINTASGFCVVKLKQRTEPSEETFKQEKQDFSSNLLGTKKQEYFSLFLNELKKRPNTFLRTASQGSP